VNVVDVDSSSVILSHRLSPLNAPPLEKGTPAYLSLQEILIIGNCHEQVAECRSYSVSSCLADVSVRIAAVPVLCSTAFSDCTMLKLITF